MQPKIVSGKLARRLSERLDDGDLPEVTLRDLAKKLGVSYEYVRRVVRGEALPASPRLKKIATELGLDQAELESLAEQDRVQKKFPGIVPQPEKLPADMNLMRQLWDDLGKAEREDLIFIADRWAKRRRMTKSKKMGTK